MKIKEARAGPTMSEVVSSVSRIREVVAEIFVANGEQKKGIEQINLAITQMDEVTQKNAALEATGAAQSLRENSGHLSDTVNVFKFRANYISGTSALHPLTPLPSIPLRKAPDRINSSHNRWRPRKLRV